MEPQKQRSFKETFEFYERLREKSYQAAMNTSGIKGLTLTGISYQTALSADKWKDTANYLSSWNWAEVYRVAQRLPKRFEVSVWRGGQLYGLSYGRPSYKKTRLRIELIESSPVRDRTAVKEVFPIINIAAQYYAIALGAEEIRIINPVNDKVVEHYSKFGYTFVETSGKKYFPNYLYLRLK